MATSNGDTQGNEGSQIFRITKSGQYTPLSGLGSLGCNCWLLQGSDGVIYGMASTGGAYGYGGVFALDAGLPKPAPQALKFGPGRGPVGTRVRIWGYKLCRPPWACQLPPFPTAVPITSGPPCPSARPRAYYCHHARWNQRHSGQFYSELTIFRRKPDGMDNTDFDEASVSCEISAYAPAEI